MDIAAFHRDCLVLDSHTDVPMRLHEEPADLACRLPERHVDLPRLRDGGVDAVFFALFVPAALSVEAGLEHALTLRRLVQDQLRPGELELVERAEEVRQAAGRGAVAVLLGLENGRPLGKPGVLPHLASLGVRYVTLTHAASHEWCDAAGDDERHGGLGPGGAARVREMNDLGVLVDVSHVSDQAAADVLEVSRAPVVASHSSARALCDHPRNLPDELVREIARRGGVVMANAYPAFLDPGAARVDRGRMERLGSVFEALAEGYARHPGAFAEARRGIVAAHPLPPVPLSTYVDHIAHLVEVAGEEGVGIGTDFDGIPETPVGFEDAGCFPALTAALLERGLDPPAVRLVLGENFLRVMEAAEGLAR